MSEPTPLSAEELAGYRACHRKTTGTTADAEGNLHPECICGDYWPCWPSQLLATIDAQATEIAALKGQRDKAETTLEMVNALATGYGWLSEGRGMYAYDDGRYDDDVRTFVGQLLELMPSGNWLGFPEWEAKYRAMEAEIAALKGALEGIVAAIDAHHPKYKNGPYTFTQTEIDRLRRVLAGKEAQG